MWFQRLYAILYIKRHTCSPMWVADDFSAADTIEGIIRDAERIAWNSIERIMEETVSRRQKMGSKVEDLPRRIYFTVKIRTNPPVKNKFYINLNI